LGIAIVTWLFFAGYITPKLIAHFMLSRDLESSALAERLADFFASRALKQLSITPETILPKAMEWAAKEENRPTLNAVLLNVLQTDAAGGAANLLVDAVKDKLKAALQGQLGADRKEIIGAFKDAVPEQAKAILDNKYVQTFVDMVQVAGQIASIFKVRGPPE